MGSVSGMIKDSLYNFMLTSATVAIYKEGDSSLVQFGLPNNFGEFLIPQLPINSRLKLIITHVGYVPFSKNFQIPANSKNLNLGILYPIRTVEQKEGLMEEVVVKSTPPVTMDGDTL